MRRFKLLAPLLGGVLLLTACTPLTPWPPGAGGPQTSSPSSTPNAAARNGTEVASTTCGSLSLNLNPVLAVGQTVSLTADGFGAFVPVELRLMGQTAVPSQGLQADKAGIVRVRYQVSAELSAGKHLLAFIGSGPTDDSGPTDSSTSTAPAAGMNLTVTVPNVRLFHFVDAPDLSAPAC